MASPKFGICPKCGYIIFQKEGIILPKTHQIRCICCNTYWKSPKQFYDDMLKKYKQDQDKKDHKKKKLISSTKILPLGEITTKKSKNKALRFTKSLPKDAAPELLSNTLVKILKEIQIARSEDMPSIYEAITLLRKQPNLTKTLTEKYKKTPIKNFRKRFLLLRIIGEIRKSETLSFFENVLSRPLPSRGVSSGNNRMREREIEEMMMTKAVEGIGYLRKKEADKLLISLMLNHESDAIRIAAIDSYMWNHNDSEHAASILFDLLPKKFHKYVQRPRFYRGMNKDHFNQKISIWIEKWG